MGWAALDRVHPYADSNNYRYFKSVTNVTYGCGDQSTGAYSYEYYLYGPLFYYENTWWIFAEIPPEDPINYRVLNNCQYPCGTNAHAFATMVAVDSSDYLYSITLPRDVGRINGYYDFIDNVYVPQNDSDIFYEVSEESTVGPPSGTYLYKDSAYDLAMYECEKDGFTVSECETTATYEWGNLNKVSGLQFKDIACADEMNTEIALYIETFVDGIVGDILPIYTGFFTDEYEQIKFSVLNLEDKKPEDYITFMLQGYYASGGTMRYPYEKFFTYDLVADPGFENAELSRVNESFGLSNDDGILIYEMEETENNNDNKKDLTMENKNYVSVEDFQKYTEYVSGVLSNVKESTNSNNDEVMEKLIKYTEHIAEKVNQVTDYAEYLSENLDKNISYSDYLAENVNSIKDYKKNQFSDMSPDLIRRINLPLQQG